MKHFTIKITVYAPYPVIRTFREEGTKIEVAIARALRRFRKEYWKGRPLPRVGISAEHLSLKK